VRRVLERHAADRQVREAQEGFGKPVIAAKLNDYQVVAVGNTLHWSKTWKTFPDFLADYIKNKLDPAWGNAEIAKPLDQRHPLMQWYDAYCRYQRERFKLAGQVHSTEVTGIVACYLGVAYALYLLAHNVELQQRLINRLKNVGNFQGAYYELIIASILIRAGFKLTLEDEADPLTKHCEFAAVSKTTGKRYWVEAKMRSVAGMLGKTTADGGADDDPFARLINHLNLALAKPAQDERLIFIDLNAPPIMGADGKPDWLEPAMGRLERFEKLNPEAHAYVFVTNMAFHRQLEATPKVAAGVLGIGMPEFGRPGTVRLSDAYRSKLKHADAYAIGEAIERYLVFPAAFDGALPSEALRGKSRVVIGETYFFEGVDGEGITGIVTAATVNEAKKEAVIAITDDAGKSRLLRSPMSDEALADYKLFGEAFFGRPALKQRKTTNLFELFEWFMETTKMTPRAKILEWFSAAPDLAELEKLNDEDLRIAYCERLVASVEARKATKKPAAE
jgi:hypothetical protein